MLRANAQKEEGPRHRQSGLGGLARGAEKGELLPLHHLALNGDHLPLKGQPQPRPLPAGESQGVPWAGAVADGAGRLELPALGRGVSGQQDGAARPRQAGRLDGGPGGDNQQSGAAGGRPAAGQRPGGG